MRLRDVAMVAADTARSRAYIQALCQSDLAPARLLLLRNPAAALAPGQMNENSAQAERACGFEIRLQETVLETCARAGVPHNTVDSVDINHVDVVAAVAALPEPAIIYSGVGGMILRDAILGLGKKFLHVHGGYLPEFKGSTTNYYSILEEGKCGASAIFLEREIDCGPVLLRRRFDPPADRKQLDYVFDSAYRASVLVETLRGYRQTGSWNFDLEKNEGGELYYIMHPVLRHITVLGR